MTSSVLNTEVAGFGSVVVDVLMVAENLVLGRKNHVDHQIIQVGGVVPTALIVLSRLGITTKIHTVLGDDLFGQSLLAIFEKEGVKLDNIVRIKEKETPLAFVVIQKETGQRTSFYTTGNFSRVSENTFDHGLNSSTTHLLVDGHNNQMTLDLIQKARKNGTKILLDLGNPKDGLDQLIRGSDVIFVPRVYWNTLWPDKDPQEAMKILLQSGPQLVILTMEEKGCLIGQQGTNVFYQPSYAVKAVDTNGAGDVFFGAFTYGLIQSWPIEKIAQFAAAAAARSCTIIGKDLKIPHSEKEVLDFIKTNKLVSAFG